MFIFDNIINGNNGGLEIDALEESTVTIVMQENVVTNNNGAGLFANLTMNSNSKFEILDNTFMGNNLTDLNSGSAVTMIPENSANVCLRLQFNQSTLEATQPDYYLHNMGSGPFNVEPLIGNTGTFDQSGTTSVPADFCGP